MEHVSRRVETVVVRLFTGDRVSYQWRGKTVVGRVVHRRALEGAKLAAVNVREERQQKSRWVIERMCRLQYRPQKDRG